LVDDPLERLEGLRPREETPVDEEGRSARDAELLALLLVHRDGLLRFPRLEAGVERLLVQSEVFGVLLELILAEGLLVGEELVVVLPELSLLPRALRRLRRPLRERVHGQREVAVHDADPVTVGILDLLESRTDSPA